VYSVEFSNLALKQLKKVNKELKTRIIAVIKRCRIRPYSYVKKIVDSPYYRLRVGDYRVIIDIIDNELKIIIIEMDHRKSIYK